MLEKIYGFICLDRDGRGFYTPAVSSGRTLVSSLSALRRGPGRGFRFVARDRSEAYFPYETLEEEAHKRASKFAAMGLEKGDRVALVIPEPKDFVLNFLGASVAGVVPVPIYPQVGFKNVDGYVEKLAHIVGTARAKSVLCMETNREVVSRIVEPAFGVAGFSPDQIVTTEVFDREPVTESPPPAVTPDDLCFLQFTSGSTSKPKGVMVTHGNLVANASAFLGPNGGLDRNDDDVGVSWLPLFHDMGLIGFVLGTLVSDIPVVILPTETFARSPGLWLETITKHRGTITYAPNFAYDLVTKRVKEKAMAGLDLSTLRVAGSGAEPIRARTLRAFAEKFSTVGFKDTAFLPSYGMAEATLAITFHELGTPLVVDVVDDAALQDGVARPATESTVTKLEILSCGKAFASHQVKIVDEKGAEKGERQVGQIITRGPSVTAGYFENEEATNAAWKDGYLYTGDLGYFAEGNLFICGRIKDLIIIRGANYYPQDLEWSVTEIEGVRRGNVFAFSVPYKDNEALIMAAEGNRAQAETLRTQIAETIGAQFSITPHEVLILPVGTLPKTSSGKAQRQRARQQYLQGELQKLAHP